MEVPAELAGKIVSLAIKLGDKVGKGTVIGEIEVTAEASSTVPAEPTTQSPSQAAPLPTATPSATSAAAPRPTGQYSGVVQHECEVLVLGAGPGGYSAAFRSADLGMKTILLERYAALGGVCLNVGCIPSKALLHTAAVMDEVKSISRHGVRYSAPEIDLAELRTYKDSVIGKLTTGLAGMAKARKVTIVRGVGHFLAVSYTHLTLPTKRIV